jgi:WD40 repeat protein
LYILLKLAIDGEEAVEDGNFESRVSTDRYQQCQFREPNPRTNPMKLHHSATLQGHKDRVWCVAWHPQGNIIASSSGDKTVRLWQRPTPGSSSNSWNCIAILEGTQTRTIRSVAWSPDGTMLAAASFDATTAVWKLKKTPNNQMSDDNDHDNEEDDDEDNEIMSILCILEGHEHEVKSVAWSPDGKYLATSSRDKTAWVWDCDEESLLVADIECMAVLVGHSQDVKCAKWIPGTHDLCTASYDNTVRVWPCDEDEEDWPLEDHKTMANEHSSTVWSVAFEPISSSTSSSTSTSPTSSQRFVSCGDDAKLVLWSKGKENEWSKTCEIGTPHDRPIYTVSWSAMGLIASAGGDDQICVYRQNSKGDIVLESNIPSAHLSDINGIEWNPTNPTELVSAGDDYMVKIWEYR